MRRRITALVLAISLLCILPAGCQGDDKAADNMEESTERLVQRPDPVTVVVYQTYLSKESLNKVKDLEDRIRDILNIHFDIRFVPNLGKTEDERIAAIKKFLESGTEFDLLILNSVQDYLIDHYFSKTCNSAEFIATGKFMDITDLLPLYAPRYYSLFSPEDLQAISYNGRIYNIPELTFDSQKPCVLVRRSVMEKYGIKDIKTFEDFENYMELIKEKESNYFPCYMFSFFDSQMFIEIFGYVPLCGNIVYRRDDPEMKLIPWEQTDAFKMAVNTIRSWLEKKYDLFSSETSGKEQASVFCPLWFYDREAPQGDEWVLCQLYPDNIISRIIPRRRVFISRNSKNAERILRLIEWMNESQENYDLGIYVGASNYYYYKYNDKTDYIFEKEEYIEAVTRNSPYPPHSGYNPPVRLMEKIAERCDDYDAVLDLNTRTSKEFMSPEAVEQFIRQQKDKGVDVLVKELQEDLDAWRRRQSG